MLLRRIIAITCFAASAAVLVFAILALINSAGVISEAIAFGQITLSGNIYEIISFFMAAAGQYFIFAILLCGMGILLCPKCCGMDIKKEAATQVDDETQPTEQPIDKTPKS